MEIIKKKKNLIPIFFLETQPLRTLTLIVSWLYTQFAFTVTRLGLLSTDFVYKIMAYPNDDEMELEKVTESDEPYMEPESMNENVNKPASEVKDDVIYDQFIRIRRTRPEPCDQTVKLFFYI